MSICCLAFTFSVSAINNKLKSSADLGVINKEQIYYWLEKRGQLSSTASIDEKKQALTKYLGKKSFGYKKLPGEYGKKYMFTQQKGYRKSNLSVYQKSGVLNESNSPASLSRLASTEAKVLALMIDFTDLKHDQNGNSYPASHYSDLLFADTVSGGVESVYQYYQHESGGTLDLTGSVQGWLSADNEAASYGGNDEKDDDKNVPALVLEAITKAVAELNIDLADYDLDNNGVIDHVMIFHSSIGEEAGGGTLGADAIWSHSSAVTDGLGNPVNIPGSPIKLYGYTINPIDAQIGVVAHEFGHDLGVRDEYDGTPLSIGSPVANWSIMASGSWVDGGAHPSGFSPHAKDYFQNQYGGNWINQQEISFEQLNNETINLVSATNHQQGLINQVKINLPISEITFTPYNGEFQFYSNEGHQLNNSLSFDVDLPAGISTLAMKAHWDIEIDYDYVQVLVNGNPITGNHTQLTNPQHNEPNDTVINYISNKSTLLSGAEGSLGWVDLTFDLSEFANQAVTIKITYITDKAAKGYGFVADNINILNNNNTIINLDAETNNVMLDGFSRAKNWTISGPAHNYYVQLRSHTDTDKFLSGFNYDPGILLWYRNDEFTDNDITNHPGDVFIGVVDADQNSIKSGNQVRNTSRQIRDAAFSLFDQSVSNGDSHLTANTKFDDKDDYAAEYQPESGLNLPTLGLTVALTDQFTDSTSATIFIKNSDVAAVKAEHDGLSVSFSVEDPYILANSQFTWQMGDNTRLTGSSVNHTYSQNGTYEVSVSYQTNAGTKTLNYQVVVGEVITGEIKVTKWGKNVIFIPELTGGFGVFSYRWDFGDDTKLDSTIVAEHNYAGFGSYNIVLTVTDETNQSFIFLASIILDNLLTVSFSPAIVELNAIFTANVIGGDELYVYLWDFGDGNSSTEKDPSHTYAAAGDYNVTLTVTDGASETTNSSIVITVIAPVVITPPVVTPPVVTAAENTSSSDSSGGGSFGYWLLGGILILHIRNFYTVKRTQA
jgi:immune inhibitor A